MIMHHTSRNCGFAALSNIRRALSSRSLVVYGTSSPVYVTKMFNNLRSNVASRAARMFVRDTCFSPMSVHHASGERNVGASTSFHCRENTSP